MRQNLGTADRFIRMMIAAVIIALFFSGMISDILGIVLLAVGIVFAATAVIGFCPIYAVFHVNTLPTEGKDT
ncbi:MAG TPA: DUF2892 domain-containing protein [Flavisolibacter sp.]